MTERWGTLVIGGGFYGLYLAEHLARRCGPVLLCEREADLMQRTSYVNQARVHNGYHYPRSILTAVRSRANFPQFVAEFGPAIDFTFTQIYAVARRFSKVSSEQYYRLMQRIGAPIRPAQMQVKKLFDPALIEDVFWTQEHAFNAVTLKRLMLDRVRAAEVELRYGTTVTRMRQAPGDALEVEIAGEAGTSSVLADRVFCCAYSQINLPIKNSGLGCVALKHELTELALVEVPEPMRELGVTVMDGLFFSCMPFPPRRLHSLSHVRYTPHFHWFDGGPDYRPAYAILDQTVKRTAFPHMIRDAARFMPVLRDCVYADSLWEVKTVLPRSEVDDSRPILFKPHYGLRNFHVIMGGKIDNVYDVVSVLDQELGGEEMSVMPKADVFVSVVAVLRNHAAIVPEFVSEASRLLEANYNEFEILLVDNGSEDGTPAAVRAVLREYRCVRFLQLTRRMEHEIAVMAGLDVAIGDFVVNLHPDFDPIDVVVPMVEQCRSGSDVVLGVETGPQPGGLLYRTLRRAFLILAHWLMGTDLIERVTDFRVLSRHAVSALTRVRQRRRYFALVIRDIGFPTALHHYRRTSRSGAWPETRLLRSLRTGFSFIIHDSVVPLRLVSVLGLLGSSLILLYTIYVVLIFLVKKDVMPGWTTLSMQTSGLFLLVFIMMTLIGEYLGRILEESSDRPLYHVREEQASAVVLSDLTRPNVLNSSDDESTASIPTEIL